MVPLFYSLKNDQCFFTLLWNTETESRNAQSLIFRGVPENIKAFLVGIRYDAF